MAVLFARSDSIYKTLPGCDVWDKERNAMLYDGELPIISHDTRKKDGTRKYITKSEREATPLEFAKWLMALAKICVR